MKDSKVYGLLALTAILSIAVSVGAFTVMKDSFIGPQGEQGSPGVPLLIREVTVAEYLSEDYTATITPVSGILDGNLEYWTTTGAVLIDRGNMVVHTTPYGSRFEQHIIGNSVNGIAFWVRCNEFGVPFFVEVRLGDEALWSRNYCGETKEEYIVISLGDVEVVEDDLSFTVIPHDDGNSVVYFKDITFVRIE